MKNYKVKKSERRIKRIILLTTMVLLMVISTISPATMILAYDDSSEIINATFSETKAEDQQTATIHLNIAEKENQEIQSIKLPDGSDVKKDTFQRNDKQEILVDYKADKNSEYAYTVFYSEKKQTTETLVKEEVETTIATVLEEKITHEVTDLKVIDDFKLAITANDITFSSTDKIDVMSGIVIKNEDDKDITSSQTVSVVDYDKLFSGLPGTYPVKYETIYSNNEKTYTFSRNITITDTTEKKAKSRTATPKTDDLGISLSTSNTGLTDVKDFVIGKKGQESFNITVFYNDSSAELDRKLKIHIPKGFMTEGRLDASSLDGASNIEYDTLADGQTVVTITFVDGRTVVTGFDMNIKQDKKSLYEMANLDNQAYPFQVEQMVGTTSVTSKQFQITTDKLTDSFQDDGITIDPIKATVVNKDLKIYASNSGEEGTIEIKKKAFTDLSLDYFILPTNMDLNGKNVNFSFTTYELYLGGVRLKSGLLQKKSLDNHIRVPLTGSIEEFKYAYEDVTLKLKGVNAPYAVGDMYYSPEIPYQTAVELGFMKENGISKSFGFISANPQLSEPKITDISNRNEFNNGTYGAMGMWKGKRHDDGPFANDSNNMWFRITDVDNLYKEVNSTFEFPYAVQPFKIYTQGSVYKLYQQGKASVELTTNKRTLLLKEADHPIKLVPGESYYSDKMYVDFEKDLQAGEYVSKIKINHPLVEMVQFKFGYNVMETNEDGTPIGDLQKASLKATLSSPQTPDYKKTYENIVSLVGGESNSLSMKNLFTNPTVEVGNENVSLPLSYIEGKFNQLLEEDLVIDYENDKLLSLADGIRVASAGTDGAFASEFSSQVVYATNLRDGLIAKEQVANSGKYDFELMEGEYVKDVQIFIKGFESKEVYSRRNTIAEKQPYIYVNFLSKKIPEVFADGTKVANTTHTYKYTLSRPDATVLSTVSGKVNFKGIVEHEFGISSKGLSGGIESSPENGVTVNPLFSIDTVSYDNHNVKEIRIDFDGTDKDLLSMIGSFRKINTDSNYFTLQYKTNLGRDVNLEVTTSSSVRRELDLAHNEYITEMTILYKNYKGPNSVGTTYKGFIDFYRREDYPRTLPIDGAMISTRNNNLQDPWEIKAAVNQDGKNTNITGSSVVVQDTSSVNISGTSKIASVKSDLVPKYQGQNEIITLPDLPIQLNGSGKSVFFRNKEDYNYIRLENPIVYLIIDKNFSVNPDDIDKQGNDIDIQFKDGAMPNGDSVLTFKFKNFEKIYRSGDRSRGEAAIISIMNDVKIPTVVKLDAKSTKTSVLKSMYYNLDDSIKGYDNYLSTLQKGAGRFVVVSGLGDKSLYKMEVESKAIDLLPLTEMGVAVMGQRGDSETSKKIVGYDHEVYKQKLSIISNLLQPTYDWDLYIPVPKKGKTVKYTDTTGVVESPEAEYSMYLDELVDTSELPAGSKIEYTTDADPLYSLDGTSVGNYTETPANLKDVTMIHITIPKLEAKQKVYPIIQYKVDGEKQKIGKQVVLGGTYFNLKLGSASGNYYRDGGIFADRLDFALKDFEVSGHVWEDTAAQANSQFDPAHDFGIADVTVKAIDKNKVEYTAKTDQNGDYKISIPSNGEIKMVVNKPNDLKADPKQKYKIVNQSIDNFFDDEDEATGTASVTLVDTDITYMSAGLWAITSVSVVGKEVIVKKGETVAVPAIAFPSENPIIYSNATNKNIATVDSDGIVAGIKVGTTKATVTVKDEIGISGDATDEYTIKVIPNHGPTVETDVINTFGSVGYDPKSNIVIKGGEDELISLDDTSKVVIDDSAVDTTRPGRYPIVYTVDDGYNEITYTRFVYIHGEVTIDVPADKTFKQGTTFDPAGGATASYIHVNEDGSTETREVGVSSTLGASVSLPNIETVTIPLHAEVDFGTAKSEAQSTYLVNVHGETTITAVNPIVTVKVGETMANIKNLIQATASMETPNGIVNPTINWDNFKNFDTTIPSNTITANVTTTDPDTGVAVTKEITIHISKDASITAPDKTDIVVGDRFDPTKNIVIVDGDGNTVVITPDIITNDIPVSADGTTTTPGNYDVEYKYKDAYGNEATAKTTVKVHGALQFDDTRVDRIQTIPGAMDDLNDNVKLAKLAWYINSDGNKQSAIFVKSIFVNPSINGRHTQNIKFKHPFKTDEQTFSRKIYTHGQTIIHAPTEKVVKVGTKVNKVDGATATYIHANDTTNETKNVNVTSSTGDTVTRDAPSVVEVPLYAESLPVPGLVNTATGKYKVIFNGYPSINTAHDSIKIKVGATPQEIKDLLQAQASVHYGKDALPTDITNLVNWDDLDTIDTSVKKAEYTLKISATDNDGATIEKEIKITISDEIIMNLPNVDKVIGDTFDPFENVEILDGDGDKVDSKDITVDDSKVDMTKPGSYDVTYTYKDELGNEKTETNTVRVNGKLQIEGLDRIDLIEKKDDTYVLDSGKAFYIDYNKKKVSVSGAYDRNVDMGIVKKNEIVFQATHPVDKNISTGKQNVYVHGDIEFNQKEETLVGKVGSSVNLKDNYTSSYQHVNDDGTITKKNVPVIGQNVTSNKVGYVNSEISAKVEIIDGLINEKKKNAEVAFNGLPFIQSASTVYFKGEISKDEVIKAMAASAGMKKADGMVVDLTSVIDFSDLNNIALNKSGKYVVTITVKDQDGFVTYKDIEITIDIPTPENPVNPEIPVIPETPTNPEVPAVPDEGENGNGNTGDNTNNGNNGNTDDNTNNDNNGNTENKKDDVITIITKDIPLSKAKNGITEDLVKSYITANSKNFGDMDFDIVSHTVKDKTGTYEVTIRLADGSERTISIKVEEDALRDVQQPEFGRDADCIIQWILLLLLLGYSGFSITAILKRRQENAKLEKVLGKYSKNVEGEVNKQ